MKIKHFPKPKTNFSHFASFDFRLFNLNVLQAQQGAIVGFLDKLFNVLFFV